MFPLWTMKCAYFHITERCNMFVGQDYSWDHVKSCSVRDVFDSYYLWMALWAIWLHLTLNCFSVTFPPTAKVRKLQLKVRIQRGQGQEDEGDGGACQVEFSLAQRMPKSSGLAQCLARVGILQTPQCCSFVLILMCFAAQNRSYTVIGNISWTSSLLSETEA